ncbi:hypothetical protein ACWFPQ_14365 [Peribacillus butanolivorans]
MHQDQVPSITLKKIGITAVPGSLTKRDSDIKVRVKREEFDIAKS